MTTISVNMDATGLNIRKLMDNADVSVSTLQNIFGFNTPQAIYKWLHGKSLPTVDNLIILAYVLKVKVDDILIWEMI